MHQQIGAIADAQLDVEPEATADAELALHVQRAAHQFHQALADHQAQPGTAVAPGGGGFRLGEAVEDALQLMFADANARIAHRHAQPDVLGRALQAVQADHHLTTVGELEGVAGQVDQYLLQAQAVALQHGGQEGVDVEHDLDVLVALVARQYHGQVAQHGLQLEIMQIQLQLAGLDLRVIENVVEQAEQGMRGALCLEHVVELTRIEVGGLYQLQHAQHRIHRRTDFVAHVGQEGALGGAGSVGLLLGMAQAGFELQLRGDVAVDPGDLHRYALQVALDVGARLDVQHLPIGPDDTEYAVEGCLASHHVAEIRLGGRPVVRVNTIAPEAILQPLFTQFERIVVQLEHPLVPLQAIVCRCPRPDTQFRDPCRHRHLVMGGQGFAAQAYFLGQIQGDAQVADETPCRIAHGGDQQGDREVRAILAHVGPFAAFRIFQLRLVHEHAEAFDGLSVLLAELFAARPNLLWEVEERRRLHAYDLLRVIPQQAFGAPVEHANHAFEIGGDDRHFGG